MEGFDAEFTGCTFFPACKVNKIKYSPCSPLTVTGGTGLGEATAAPPRSPGSLKSITD